VAPATLIDLTAAGSEGTANGALFQQYDAVAWDFDQDWFLEVQGRRTEQGYNTNAAQTKRDGNEDAIFAKAITLGEIPLATIDGVEYRVFFLDVAQTTRSPLVSLDELRIYTSLSSTLSGYDTRTDTLGGQTAIWDMDGAGDVFVRLNSDLNADGELGDAFVYIPNSVFDGLSDSTFIYLFSKFGGANRTNGGAESWGLKTPPAQPPSGASLSLTVYEDTDLSETISDGDLGLAGILVNLVDANGIVVDTQETNSDGSVIFANIAAGTYSIEMVAPSESTQMFPNVGTSSDSNTYDGDPNVSWTGFTEIELSAGETATGYELGVILGAN
jgi:hypothetical protein